MLAAKTTRLSEIAMSCISRFHTRLYIMLYLLKDSTLMLNFFPLKCSESPEKVTKTLG